MFFAGNTASLVRPAWRERWLARMVRTWARGLGRVAGMRVHVIGSRPARPFFLVANHLSYVDIVLLLSEVEAVFVAKRELAMWPVVGYLARLTGTIFIDRRASRDVLRVLDRIEARIRHGQGVAVFPEGTSSAGDGVRPLRPSLFEWAARAGAPVHVAAIRYDAPPGWPAARSSICWWGDMAFLPHLLGLLRLPTFRATLHFAAETLSGADRAELARRARELIAARLAQPAPGQEAR